ncbi:MAG: DHA2 family efflux MFS transporter permease subunit [Candidatus Gastranaerophilaceae bacterium]
MNEGAQTKCTNPYLIAIVALLPAFLALAASSATNVCQPNIAGYFGATQYEANTVVTCYIISGGIMLPVTTYLANFFGQKQYLIYCIVLFTLGCLFCILARDLHMLILARLVQGIGSGSILPICQATLLDAFPPEKRGVAMGLFGVAAMFSPLAGPYMGGYLTDNWSWQWVFIINIPLCILSIILIKFILPDTKPLAPEKRKKFDITGFIAICFAMGCLQIVLDKGEQFNWFDTQWICWMFGVSVFCFIFFYIWELECNNPVIDIRVFKDKNFLYGTIISSFINLILYSTLLIVPLFVQGLLGYSPSMSGYAMFPRAITCFIGLIIFGELSRHIEGRILTTIGFLIMGGAIFWMRQLSTTASLRTIIIPNIILCVGVAAAFVPITALSFLTLPASKRVDAASLHALFKNIVTAISTAMSATFLTRVAQVHQNYLVDGLSWHNPMFRIHLTALQNKFATYYAPVYAAKKANGALYKEMLKQAKLCAFHDAFLFLTFLAITIIPLIFILKNSKMLEKEKTKII